MPEAEEVVGARWASPVRRSVHGIGLVLGSAAWTGACAWAYLHLADGLLNTHPLKGALVVLCAAGLWGMTLMTTSAGSWMTVLVVRPLLQTVGFLCGMGAVLAGTPAGPAMALALARLDGLELVVALGKPLAAPFLLAFLAFSLFAFAVERRRARR